MIKTPALRSKPLVKVLAPLSTKAPAPDFLTWPPAEVIGAEMTRDSLERPETVITGAALLSCRAEKEAAPVLMTGVVEKESLIAVMALAAVSTTVLVAVVGVPKLKVGLPVPPWLLKLRLAKVWVGPAV